MPCVLRDAPCGRPQQRVKPLMALKEFLILSRPPLRGAAGACPRAAQSADPGGGSLRTRRPCRRTNGPHPIELQPLWLGRRGSSATNSGGATARASLPPRWPVRDLSDSTSNRPAAPMPPPMHMVTTTRRAPRRLPSISRARPGARRTCRKGGRWRSRRRRPLTLSEISLGQFQSANETSRVTHSLKCPHCCRIGTRPILFAINRPATGFL